VALAFYRQLDKDAIDAVIASYAYIRDPVGRITDVQESDAGGLTGTSHYDYDEPGRLTLESYNRTATGTACEDPPLQPDSAKTY
jgi:hypothetical protein